MAETSKKRTVRIPLDYYKRPDRLAWWRRLLSAVAVLLAVAWAAGIGWDFWSPSRRAGTGAPTGLARAAHPVTCHLGDRSARRAILRSSRSAWKPGPLRSSATRGRAASSARHATPPADPSRAPATPDLACASCHHDHQGRDASLVRKADQQCTQCHADLTAHVAGSERRASPRDVIRFDASTELSPRIQLHQGPGSRSPQVRSRAASDPRDGLGEVRSGSDAQDDPRARSRAGTRRTPREPRA